MGRGREPARQTRGQRGKLHHAQPQSQQPKQAQRALQEGHPARGKALRELDGDQQERGDSHHGTKPPHGPAKTQHAAQNKHRDQGADDTIARLHKLFHANSRGDDSASSQGFSW